MNTEKNKMLTLQIEKDLFKQLEVLAKNEDRSVSNLVRKIIKQYLEERVKNGK